MSADQGQAIAEAALSVVGAQFKHQGRLPEYGLDCAGVALHAFKAAGVGFDWRASYRMDPEPKLVMDALEANFARVESYQPGDVLAFRFPGDAGPKHLGIYVGGERIVHVFGRTARVRVESLVPWLPRLHSTWRRKWHQSL